MYRYLRYWIFAGLLATWLGAFQASAESIQVVTDGTDFSKDAALLKAKRNAVEQGIGTLLISQTEIENFSLKRDLILTRTVGAVQTYQVLKETQNLDDTYTVKIRASVSTSSIRENLVALKILLESMDKPRLMVVLDEPGSSSVENAIVDAMKKKGFDMVDQTMTTLALKKVSSQLFSGSNEMQAAQIGRQGGAEYILVGRVTKSVGESMYGMRSGQVAVSLRVIDCATARIITSKNATGSFAHRNGEAAISMASERAAEAVVTPLFFEELIASFQELVNNGMELNVTVQKVANYQAMKKVRAAIKKLPGTVSATKRSFTGGALTLSVQYKGSPDSFCEEIDGRELSKGVLLVTEATGNRIVMLLEMND